MIADFSLGCDIL